MGKEVDGLSDRNVIVVIGFMELELEYILLYCNLI